MKKSLWSLLALPSLLASPTFAAGGIDSLRLDPVALDARVDCDRVFFSSSHRLPGTIFVMPRVAIGTSADSQLFAIEPAPEGGYVLHVGVYFPRDDERVKVQFNRGMPDISRCNFETVQYFLNKKAQASGGRVDTIARMPLTSIQISIPGISKPYTIGKNAAGNADVDILSYFGSSYTAEFHLTEEEKDNVQRRLAHAQGLQFNVGFRFQARRMDGSLSAQVNWSALAASLKANAGAKLAISKPELEAMISGSMSNLNVKISAEESDSEAFKKISGRIIDLVLDQKDFVVETPKAAGTDSKKDSHADKNASDEKDGGKLLNLKAVINFLAKQTTKNFYYEQVGKAESATAETVVNIKTRITDPWTREVLVTSGERDPTIPNVIKKGQTIRITPAYSFESKMEYQEKKSYLTAQQVRDLNLQFEFEDLQSGRMKITNQEINGYLVGVGRKSLAAAPDAPLQIYTPTRYSWIRTERIPTEVTSGGVRVYEQGVSIAALRNIPISVTFSGLGRGLFHLADLTVENTNWSARFNESGAIILTAKRDLGMMTLRESFQEGRDFSAEDVDYDEIVQVARGPWGGVTTTGPIKLQTDRRTKVRTKTVVIYVSHPRVELEQMD